MPTFEIPDAATTIDMPRSGDPKNPKAAESSATYTVNNRSSESVSGSLSVKAEGPSKEEWFSIDGESQRDLAPGTNTVTVRLKLPPDLPEGGYPFRLIAATVRDPDNDFAEGPMTLAKLRPGQKIKPPTKWWLWALIGLVALLVIGGVIYKVFLDREPAATVTGPPAPTDAARAQQLAEKRTIEWIDAYNARDTKALVALSEPPFTRGDTLLLSDAQIRDAYTAMIDQAGSAKISIVDITPGPLSKVRDGALNDQQLQRLKLTPDDVAVEVKPQGDKLLFIFRRSSGDVRLASIVGQVREPELKMDLSGRWTDGSARSAVISSENGQIVIDMSEFNRPPAHGKFVGPTTITVAFSDDASFTGELSPRQTSPNKIAWSNGSVWYRRP